MNSTSQGIINNYMRGESYLTVGGCPDGWYGASINSDNFEEARPNQNIVIVLLILILQMA